MGAGVSVRAHKAGGGLKGAVKVGNWENSPHAQNREKEMHQRAGRGAGGAPVRRDGGRGWRGGARASGGAVMGLEARGHSLECCRATPASTSRPRLFTIYSAGGLCNRPGEDPWGGAVSSPTHLKLLRRPRLLLSSTGWEKFPFSHLVYGLDGILLSSAYREAGLEFKLLGFFFFLVEGGGRILLAYVRRKVPPLHLVGGMHKPASPAEGAWRGKSSPVLRPSPFARERALHMCEARLAPSNCPPARKS